MPCLQHRHCAQRRVMKIRTSWAFTVRASIDLGHSVRVEVEDRGGPWASATIDPDRYHGLDIIRALATDWGITGDHIARTIWARFSWPDTA